MSPPRLFDRALARERLKRAIRSRHAGFLFDLVCEELAVRLTAIQRPFATALDFGAPFSGLDKVLATPGRTLFRLAPILETLGETPYEIVGDDEAAPFRPACFDLVVSLLSLQHANDTPGVFAQAAKMLRPDGMFIGALAGGRTLQELRRALTQAEMEIYGGASPRIFPLADLRDIGALLQRAGLALPVADAQKLTVRYNDMFALMRDLRRLGATNILQQRSRKNISRALFMRAAQIYAEQFSDADGRVRATFELVWFSGWAAHDSQQRPLKRGSAQRPLAQILGNPKP